MKTKAIVLSAILATIAASQAQASVLHRIVCKSDEQPLFGLSIEYTAMAPQPIPVTIRFSGPRTDHAIHGQMTTHNASTRLGFATYYSVAAGDITIYLKKILPDYQSYKIFAGSLSNQSTQQGYALHCK